MNSEDSKPALLTPSHPFYLVPCGGEWRVYRYLGPHEWSHADYWRQSVALVVAKYEGIDFRALRELPYCLPRGRFVAQCELPGHEGKPVLFCGETLTQEQMDAVREAYGALPVLPDEHEVCMPSDVAAYRSLKIERASDSK